MSVPLYTHKCVKTFLDDPKNLEAVQSIIATCPEPTIHSVAVRTCENFFLCNARDKLQITTCENALLRLAKEGKLKFPHLNCRPLQVLHLPLRHNEPLPPVVLPTSYSTDELTINLVPGPDEMARFNTMIEFEHPDKSRLYVGNQLHYTFNIGEVIIGGVSVATASHSQRDRDMWLELPYDLRLKLNPQFIRLDHLLIREGVDRDLILPDVIKQCVSIIPYEFQSVYNHGILVMEALVEPPDEKYFSQAGWMSVTYFGTATEKASKNGKLLYIYAVDKEFNKKLGIEGSKMMRQGIYTHGLKAKDFVKENLSIANLATQD